MNRVLHKFDISKPLRMKIPNRPHERQEQSKQKLIQKLYIETKTSRTKLHFFRFFTVHNLVFRFPFSGLTWCVSTKDNLTHATLLKRVCIEYLLNKCTNLRDWDTIIINRLSNYFKRQSSLRTLQSSCMKKCISKFF